MKDTRYTIRGGAFPGAAAVLLLSAALAHGQIGHRLVLPSSFSTPLSSFGAIGGPYTGSYGGFGFNRTVESSPLSVGPAMWTRYSGSAGSESIGGIRAYASSRSPLAFTTPISSLRPLGMPFAAPLADPLTVSLPSSVPEWGAVYIPGRSTTFDRTITPDSFLQPKADRPTRLADIAPSGPSASAAQAQGKGPPVEQNLPGSTDLPEMSRRLATQLSEKGAACLKDAMQALKEGRLRSERTRPGAIDLFKRARLLVGRQPEPNLGLIACLVGTADYQQAAVLVGPLVRAWPEVLVNVDFAHEYYPRPEQMRTHLLAIRDAVAVRGDVDLRLLWVFYRWYGENKRQAVAEVDRLALTQGPDSAAAAVAAAMRSAVESGG